MDINKITPHPKKSQAALPSAADEHLSKTCRQSKDTITEHKHTKTHTHTHDSGHRGVASMARPQCWLGYRACFTHLLTPLVALTCTNIDPHTQDSFSGR